MEIDVTSDSPGEGATGERPAGGPGAHREAYLKGRYHWHKGSAEELGKAREYFEQAVRVDPNMQPAMRPWLPITRCPLIFGERGDTESQGVRHSRPWNSTMGWLKRILALAGIKFYGDWDWTGPRERVQAGPWTESERC